MSMKYITAFKKVSLSCDRSSRSSCKTGNYKGCAASSFTNPVKLKRKKGKATRSTTVLAYTGHTIQINHQDLVVNAASND